MKTKEEIKRERNRFFKKELEIWGKLRHRVRGVILRNIMELEQKRFEHKTKK